MMVMWGSVLWCFVAAKIVNSCDQDVITPFFFFCIYCFKQGIRVVKKTGFENQFFQKLVFKKKKNREIWREKKNRHFSPGLSVNVVPRLGRTRFFFPAFFPRLVEPWLNHGSAFGKWLFLDFFFACGAIFHFFAPQKRVR